jgi:hypothetical protein
MVRSYIRTRARMQIEILALAVLERQRKGARFGAADRLLWVALSRLWTQWRPNI